MVTLCTVRFNSQQDRQCTYNVTIRRVRATIVAAEKQKVLHILSVCLYLWVPSVKCACVILSSVAWSALQYFSTLSLKRDDFRKKVIEHKMCVLIFSTTFVWNISHSKKKLARYDHKCISVFMNSNRYSSQILMKLEFSRQICEKYWDSKFHETSSIVSRVVPRGRTDGRSDRQTDRHDEANFTVFRNFQNAPKISKFRPRSIFLYLIYFLSQNKPLLFPYTQGCW